MPDSYLVPAGRGEATVEVRRSRFVAHVERVEDDAAARAVVDAARARHPDARHHCSASVVGPRRDERRSHDDGEPAGTAGAPMLEVLARSGVSDVVVVVTRWFGGTLLGAGGLVRAYGEAAAEALADAGTRRRRRLVELAVRVSPPDAARLEHDLRASGAAVLDTAWGSDVTLTVAVAEDEVPALEGRVASTTSGAGRVARLGGRWVDLA
ncbi:IMPACT family protein [Solicola sp. PLA-1-18]|uniref:IMPACT family protein n=1 Tax=Solicola sp. PLA-1-18 TaxID=3380532 RepID=UPI003B82A866